MAESQERRLLKVEYEMDSIETITRLLKDLEQRRFYGGLEIKVEAGRVVLIRKTENIKPQDYRDNRGEHSEQH